MLYIMRHGQTDWNVIHKLQGRTDIPLNDCGKSMAQKAAEEYKSVHFDICYCSPLVRAAETAEILLKGRNVPIIYDERLREMSFGIYEGVENSYDDEELPINVLFRSPENYVEPVEGGESLESLFKRTGEFLADKVYPLIRQNKNVLIVGHGTMNSSIVSRILNLPISQFWSMGIENCKLMSLAINDNKECDMYE